LVLIFNFWVLSAQIYFSMEQAQWLQDRMTASTHRVLAKGVYRPTRAVLCWMTYLWRAIVLNGVTAMHALELYQQSPDHLTLAWRLLILRVLAVAEDCERFIVPADHPGLCAAVYSGNPTTHLPVWARRGCALPLIYDILYTVGVPVRPNSTHHDAICSAHMVYSLCLTAITGENTPDTAFVNGDAFLARTFKLPAYTTPFWKMAGQEYVKMEYNNEAQWTTEACDIVLNTQYDVLYEGLMTNLHLLQQVNWIELFATICPTSHAMPWDLTWDMVYVA
jgi:hypothetical protein